MMPTTSFLPRSRYMLSTSRLFISADTMICLQSDIGMFIFWLRTGLKWSTRKLAREMGIDLSELRKLQAGSRRPAFDELAVMIEYSRRIVADGILPEPRKPYAWNWAVPAPLEERDTPARPMIYGFRDFYR